MLRLCALAVGCAAFAPVTTPGGRLVLRAEKVAEAPPKAEVAEAKAAPDVDKLRFLTEAKVEEVRKTFGTPCFVYDAASLRDRAREALDFPSMYGVTPRYAMKASPNAAIIQIFDKMGLHFDASSVHEARRAMVAGVAASKISLSTQQLDADFAEVLEQGVKLNACSLQQLRMFAAAFPGGRCGVRFNPGLGSGGTSKTNVGGPGSSFGIWHGEVGAVQAMEKEGLFQVERIHTHIGSGSDPEVWQRVANMSLDLCAKFEAVHTLNLGGGYKVARMRTEKATDLQKVGEPVKEEFAAFAKETGRELKLEIEPGTFLVANAASLVTTVQDVIATTEGTAEGGRDFLKLDCGMTEVLRPSLYGSQHPVVVVNREGKTGAAASSFKDYVVVGHCCESGDLMTPAPDQPEVLAARTLAEAQTGDALVIESVGAYCSAMATKHYNSFPEAPEVLLAPDGTLHCIRRRSNLEQIIQNEVMLPEDVLN